MDQKIIYFLLILILNKCTINALEPRDIAILIISQNTVYNNNLAEESENDIKEQSKTLNKAPPIIYISHRDFPHIGDWTILPILPKFIENENFVHWLFVCDDRTKINLDKLVQVLNNYNYSEKIWLGHTLYDQDVTIIHHFAFHENPTSFLYPNLGSGFAISMPLVAKISNKYIEDSYENNENLNEFSIDSMHELSLYFWENASGHILINEPKFCVANGDGCATYVKPFKKCGEPVNINSLFFAVKTCHKFHDNRLNVVKNTWAKYIKNINFFSDIFDEKIPTVTLNIPNTEHGHCEKTFEIIKYFYNNFNNNKNIEYLVITDDDTIISPYRLTNLLSCYKDEEFLALGERYGYHTLNLEQKGYNYLTGGAGTILNKNIVEKIIDNDEFCTCPKNSSPDDMFLGVCLARLGVKMVHSPQFHQARPSDYPEDYLSRNEAISFHKHWMVDPEKIYVEWFMDDDKKLFQNAVKDEL